MRVAKAVALAEEERATLTKWARGRSTPARLVQRARIILAAADGRQNLQIALELGCTKRTVATWRNRFIDQRLDGLRAERAPRRPQTRAALTF